MSDNPILNINGEGLSRLKLAMALADECENPWPGRKPLRVAGYALSAAPSRLVFFDREDVKDMTPFPTPLSLERAAEIAFDWLDGGATYGQGPDHDGENAKGWRCYREAWGRIDGFGHGSFVAIEPCWIMYGK